MNTNQFTLALISLAATLTMPLPCAAHDDHAAMVVIRDDCDPRDPAWAPSGGCLRKEGDVDMAEFRAELSSPFSTAVIGHQAWRNDPLLHQIMQYLSKNKDRLCGKHGDTLRLLLKLRLDSKATQLVIE